METAGLLTEVPAESTQLITFARLSDVRQAERREHVGQSVTDLRRNNRRRIAFLVKIWI